MNLRKIRTKHGLRQLDVAAVLNVSPGAIANYEQGVRTPNLLTLIKLVDFFHISLDYLAGRNKGSLQNGAQVVGLTTEPVVELSKAARQCLDAMIEADVVTAEAAINREIQHGFSIQNVYMQILQPVLYEVGRLWETDELDVYQEHVISELTLKVMSRLMSRVGPPKEGPVFIGLAVGGEQHYIGIRMITDLLTLERWKTINLGINLPTSSILKVIRDCCADVVGISATMAYNLNAVANLIQAIRSSTLCSNVVILVGGIPFNQDPQLWRNVGADDCALDGVEAVRLLQKQFG